MAFVHTKWGKRWVVVLLLASLLPVTFATAMQTARHTNSFSDWLRGQLLQPEDEAVVQALAQAESSGSTSLSGFLRTFIEAYEATRPGGSPAHIFASLDLSNDALVAYLESRYLGLEGTALPPRTSVQATQIAVTFPSDRDVLSSAFLAKADPLSRQWTTTLRYVVRPVFVFSLRSLWAAQPLGP